ncbi:MAG: hypothetical protein KC917_16660 [Candidatus Omnitrophica bacterium]|nr:hypothetical protein [Candidatus Omnitrophota bacterium]
MMKNRPQKSLPSLLCGRRNCPQHLSLWHNRNIGIASPQVSLIDRYCRIIGVKLSSSG